MCKLQGIGFDHSMRGCPARKRALQLNLTGSCHDLLLQCLMVEWLLTANCFRIMVRGLHAHAEGHSGAFSSGDVKKIAFLFQKMKVLTKAWIPRGMKAAVVGHQSTLAHDSQFRRTPF